MTRPKLMTLSRHITENEKKHPQATGELSRLLSDLSLAAKLISIEVNKAGLSHVLGYTGQSNIHGEKVKKLDIFAHEVLVKSMDHGGHFCAMVSEEKENIIHIPSKHKLGKYILFFDPLDGSSNIEVNNSIGTIFSVYKRKTAEGKPAVDEDCLQAGINQVAAGYVLYGSSTILVYTTGEAVHGFTLDPSLGEFLLSHNNIRIPERASIYSINEGNYNSWTYGLKKYIDYLKGTDKQTDRPYTLRYVGSLVADIHRTLLYGGIFMYPADKRYPEGKLRLMYECNPMSMIVEAAGGRAIDGRKRIMEIIPTKLHERSPLFIGSEKEIKLVDKLIQ